MRTNKFLIFFLFLFLNLWIWKIFFEDFLIFSILIVITVASYKKFITDRKKSLVLVQLLMILLTVITQYLTTSISSLTELTNDQIRIRDMRLREYPPVFIRLGAKTLWLPVAYRMEARPESIAIERIQENIFESLDINQYFFASHPRQRVGVKEFEKFPYILLPFFILGIVKLINNKDYGFIIIYLVLPILFVAFVGNKNPLGNFSVFPFLLINITVGVSSVFYYISQSRLINTRVATLSFFAVLVLNLLQSLAYETY